MSLITRFHPSDSNKAVSDGAISFHLDHMVKTRVSKVAYGTFRQIEYDPDDLEHVARKNKMKVMPSGRELIPDAFATILPRVSSSLFLFCAC